MPLQQVTKQKWAYLLCVVQQKVRLSIMFSSAFKLYGREELCSNFYLGL